MPRKLRTLFLEPKTYISAIFTVQSQLIRYLHRDQVEVFVACEAGDASARPPTFTAMSAIPNIHLRATHYIPSLTNDSKFAIVRKMAAAAWNLPALALYGRRQRIDIVHTSAESRDGAVGVALARLMGARSVVHLHMNCAEWMSSLTRWSLTHADAVLAVSETTAQSAVNVIGVRPERVYVLRNGIQLSEWDCTLDGAPVRQEFGIPAEAPLIVVISRIYPWKGLADLIQSLAIVHEQLPEARLLIVGGDDLGATPDRKSYTQELRELAVELGQGDHVIFAGRRADIPQILAAADVFALLTPDEAFGLVYLEAMTMKKPIVALNVSGPTELIEDGKSGFLVSPNDNAQAARALLQLLSNPALRTEMGAYGRKRAETHYDVELVARDMLKVYERILAAPPNRASLRAAARQEATAAL